MNNTSLKVAVVQMVSSENFEENLLVAKRLIQEAAEDGASLIVLPEYFSIMALKEIDKFEYVESHLDGPMQALISQLANKLGVWIVAGSHPIKSDESQRPYGRCYVYNECGSVVTWYDKIHLFDVTVGDNTQHYCESRYTKAGESVVSFESPWGTIGLAICYDIRFPELFRELAERGCEVFIIPAAFTHKTGKQHWQLLLQARAVENLCYAVASAQGGEHANGRLTWGHSCIISPWGEVLAEVETGQGYVLSNIDRTNQQLLRKEFPVLSHKKL